MGEVLAVDFIISKTSFLVKYKLRRDTKDIHLT